ncbi:phosphatidate cytidylyltransferase [Candidatus Blochmanniella camponoti]|uniref:Phosphatidate cytidylyltransferase n=1 Tax=Candidatus Blochmanniella camponoti TaxID=108080 RepID=A0AAE9I675_9ENTR|nr:phosphatidate cytidylyltransferase [Candidatus Blochmannia herculeanus]URJ24692.1 phosphatidate cytidylyltransferase [Candidatus Blochmannia herculeanus]URJ26701.1 phosphatidate cytidylyltransferase [Candidatus Blochmannia herculeanus]URJ27494.1 phosphatidate cytidylyltransferase [Candidatus Blochmannia herculeanus]
MLKTRLISMLILIPITILMVFFLPIIPFSIVVFIICLISAWEWGKMHHFSDYVHRMWICAILVLLCITMIIVTTSYLYFNNWHIFWYIFGSISIVWWLLAFSLILSYPDSAIFWKKSNVLCFFFGILTILPFFWGILTLRQFHHINDNTIGAWCLLYIVILIWINDSSAYIIGKTLGRHKLLKNVSPKKTWEGFIGGILISTGISWLFSKYMPIKVINPSLIFVYSIIAIIASIIGDLTESMFKREAGIKDSGSLIPGHGGILDRIDSLFAAVPIFVYLILLSLY